MFEIETRGGRVILRGNNGVSIGAALNWYLKYYCNCHYSLKARQVNLPKRLPAVEPRLRCVSRDQSRLF